MIDRFSERKILKNNNNLYENIFFDRNVKFINQYSTPNFVYPDYKNIGRLNIQQHIWTTGDRFYKLAAKYYGDPKDWWIIAKFNNTPTESHVKIGDTLLIPGPLQEAVNLLKG